MKILINFVLSLLIGITVPLTSLHAEKPDAIVNSFNQFAFDLYQGLANNNDNLVFSPYSLSSLFGPLLNGAQGNSRKQILHVLHLDNTNLKNINNTFLRFDNSLNQKSLLIGNSLWIDNNFKLKTNFLNIIKSNASYHVYEVDFNKPELVRQKINKWVSLKTQQLIQQFLPESSITTDTKLMLTSAIYFKGKWQEAYDKKNTENNDFKLANGKTIKIPMMHQQNKFLYSENDQVQLLQLSYQKSSLVMAILLPKDNISLKTALSTINEKTFSKLIKQANKKEVNVSLPKFSVSTMLNNLNEILQKNGMTEPFSEKADFSNMTNNKLMISDVLQKTVIKVDEEGTIAAAATEIGLSVTSFEPPIQFNANHPFLFIIFDKPSSLILFIGLINHPKV